MLGNMRAGLLEILSRPAERTLERKALVLIKEISLNGDNSDGNLSEIYTLAHAALGRCGNPHSDWVQAIVKQYRRLRRDELRRKREYELSNKVYLYNKRYKARGRED